MFMPYLMPYRRALLGSAIILTLITGAVSSATASPTAPANTAATIDLSAEARRAAPNDLAQVTAYFESTDADPAVLSQAVNRVIADALELIKRYPDVKASTSGINTWPVHSKNGRTIEAWRMRSAISLESTDIPALSDLLGQLQASLAVDRLVMQPSPETRNKTADLAATDAIRAFEARALSVADTLGKGYRIRHLSINYGNAQGPMYPVMRSAMMAADSAPAPLEGGESQVVVNVSGTIELTD